MTGADSRSAPDCCSCGRSDQVVMAPEAGYWLCSRCGERGSGTEEPIWWRNDPESQWYVEDADTAPEADGDSNE